MSRRSVTGPPGSYHSATTKPSAVEPIVFPRSGGAIVGVLIPSSPSPAVSHSATTPCEDSNDAEHSTDSRRKNLGGMQFKVGKLDRSQGTQGRKSLRLCWAGLRIRRFDPVAKLSELPDHLPSAPLPRFFGDRWAPLFVMNSLVQDEPDQSTLSRLFPRPLARAAMRPAIAVVGGCRQIFVAQTGILSQLRRPTQPRPASLYEHRFPLSCKP
jgi:hypothetical protein